MTDTKKDYLAVIWCSGAGSYARGPNKDDVIRRVASHFKSDFKGIFKCGKGDTVKINVVDVTGYDSVAWDDSGFFIGDRAEQTPIDREIEVVKHTY